MDIKNPRTFDCNGHHPNIQKPIHPTKCIAYCKKEDPEPLEEGIFIDPKDRKKLRNKDLYD